MISVMRLALQAGVSRGATCLKGAPIVSLIPTHVFIGFNHFGCGVIVALGADSQTETALAAYTNAVLSRKTRHPIRSNSK
jgi:hypothetical protein